MELFAECSVFESVINFLKTFESILNDPYIIFLVLIDILRCLIFFNFANKISKLKDTDESYKSFKRKIQIVFVLIHILSFSPKILYGVDVFFSRSIFVIEALIYSSIFYVNYLYENIVLTIVFDLTNWFITYIFRIIVLEISNRISLKIEFLNYVYLTFSMIITYFAATKILPRFIDYNKYTLTNKEYYILIFFSLSGFISLYYKNHVLGIAFGTICLVAIVILSYEFKLFKQNEKYSKWLLEKNNLLEGQNKLIKEKDEEKYKSYQRSQKAEKNIKKIYNDLNDHLNFLLSCENLPREAEAYINKLKDEINKCSCFYNTGSSIVDLILEEKHLKAEKSGIEFNVTGDFGDELKIDPSAANIIFEVSLNNAIELANQLKDDYKRIDVTFYQGFDKNEELDIENKSEEFYLKVVSAAETENINISKNKIYSSPPNQNDTLDKIDLESLEKAVKSCYGTIKTKIIRNKFILEVYIPIKFLEK